MKKNKKFLVSVIVLVAIILACIFIEPLNLTIRQMIATLSMGNIEAAKGYILSFGIWAPVISFLLMILQSIIAILPAFIITFANAALFGSFWGGVLSWSSAMVGAALCFFIVRIYGRGALEYFIGDFSLGEVDKFFERHGKYTILIARLLPFMPFDVVSFAAGATNMSFMSFFIATGIGQLPATIVYSMVGEKLVGGAQVMVTGLLILFAFTTFGFMMKKIYSDRKEKNKVRDNK